MKLMHPRADGRDRRCVRARPSSSPRFKILARVKHIQRSCSSSGRAGDAHAQRVRAVPPRARAGERVPVARSTGDRVPARQQGRRRMLEVLRHDPTAHARARRGCSTRPPSTTSSCATSRGEGCRCPRERAGARLSPSPTSRHPGRRARCSATIYAGPASSYWDAYEMCEKLVDVEERFQLWRFRHMKTVERDHRLQAGHGRHRRRGLPQASSSTCSLPGAVGGAHRAQGMSGEMRSATSSSARAKSYSPRRRPPRISCWHLPHPERDAVGHEGEGDELVAGQVLAGHPVLQLLLESPSAKELRVGHLVAHLDEVLHRQIRDGVGIRLARGGESGEVARPVAGEHAAEQRDSPRSRRSCPARRRGRCSARRLR